jgi:putative phosphonate metabolism protein
MFLESAALIDYVSGRSRFLSSVVECVALSVESVSVPRYAVYYAPRSEEGLAVAASQWLGRNADTGQSRPLKPVSSFTTERLAEITAEPRLYGFHGTLKAPMVLADGADERDLLAAVGNFAVGRRSVAVPSMTLTGMSDFIALVPSTPSTELQDLADSCVIEFDEFRRPADEAELARRRAAGLSPRQDELLLRWGYPYVLEEWRFHLTLTGRIADDRERSAVTDLLRRQFVGFIDRPLAVRDLCVFRQPATGRAFTAIARFTLGGGRRVSSEVWRAA